MIAGFIYKIYKKIIIQIHESIIPGNEIIFKGIPEELRFVWIDTIKKCEIASIKLSEIKTLYYHKNEDVRIPIIIEFLNGKISSTKALADIERLENLNAFW